MGFITESQIRDQSKKAQGETNAKLDVLAAKLDLLIEAQNRTNQLLEWLGQRRPVEIS